MGLNDFGNNTPLEDRVVYEGEPFLFYKPTTNDTTYQDARNKILVHEMATFECDGGFLRETLRKDLGTKYPESGFNTRYSLYELKDYDASHYNGTLPGEERGWTKENEYVNVAYVLIPHVCTVKNDNVLHPLFFDPNYEDKYKPMTDPGAYYLYYHANGFVRDMAGFYLSETMFDLTSQLKYLSYDVEKNEFNKYEDAFVNFGEDTHTYYLVNEFLRQYRPDCYVEGRSAPQAPYDFHINNAEMDFSNNPNDEIQ